METLALNATLAGPNLTVMPASYDPSSCCSPSDAPETHSTTARGSDNKAQTALRSAATSTRSFTSIMISEMGWFAVPSGAEPRVERLDYRVGSGQSTQRLSLAGGHGRLSGWRCGPYNG